MINPRAYIDDLFLFEILNGRKKRFFCLRRMWLFYNLELLKNG